MLIIGVFESGIVRRVEKNVDAVAVSLDNIGEDTELLIKLAAREDKAILYVNSLIGLRKQEYLLFTMLKKHFVKLAVVYDRLESLGTGDMEMLQKDTCDKFGLSNDNIIFINKDEKFEDAIIQKSLKYELSVNIHFSEVKPDEQKGLKSFENEDNQIDKERAMSIIALAVIGVVMLLMYFKNDHGSSGDNKDNGSSLMKTFLIPAGIFALVMALMSNKKFREIVEKIY